MKYRGWAEPETHWLVDFICAFLGGTMGIYSFPGWLLTYFGWLTVQETLICCAVVGLLFGFYILYERRREV